MKGHPNPSMFLTDMYLVMMAVARNIADADASIKAGKWERSRLVGIEAKGKTLGIIGLGKGRQHPVLLVHHIAHMP